MKGLISWLKKKDYYYFHFSHKTLIPNAYSKYSITVYTLFVLQNYGYAKKKLTLKKKHPEHLFPKIKNNVE